MAIAIPGGNPSSLGKIIVAAAGTLVALGSNFSGLSSAEGKQNLANICAWISVYANAGNTGNVYIGGANMVRATGVGVLGILVPGAGWSINMNDIPNAFNINDFYVDADNNDDWVIASMAGR